MKSFVGADLRGVNFDNCDYSGVDFTGADISGASFRKALLTGATFAIARVENVDFRGADLRHFRIRPSRGPLTDWDRKVKWSSVDFGGAKLEGAHIAGVDFSNSSFNDADMAEAWSHGARFENCEFRRAICRSVCFEAVTMSNCTLDGANLIRSNLKRFYAEADFVDPPLNSYEKMWLLEKSSWKKKKAFANCSTFKNTNIYNCDLAEAKFFGTDFSNSRFKLSGGIFYHCALTSCDFQKTDLSNTKFFSCDLSGAKFFGSLVEYSWSDTNQSLHHAMRHNGWGGSRWRIDGSKIDKIPRIVRTKEGTSRVYETIRFVDHNEIGMEQLNVGYFQG